MRTKLIETNNIGGVHIIDRDKSIFNAIKKLASNPFNWLGQGLADNLDIEYYMNHSGQKFIAPMVQTLIEVEENNFINVLASIIAEKFKDKWNKVYEALINSDYEPLENYSMEEVETPNITRDNTETTKTDITTETINDKTEAKVNGFNSTDSVPSGDTTRNGKVVVSADSDDNEVHSVQTETGDRTLTRHGNIGVTSSQQMLNQEIELRNNHNFTEMLMRDVDSVMTLLIY